VKYSEFDPPPAAPWRSTRLLGGRGATDCTAASRNYPARGRCFSILLIKIMVRNLIAGSRNRAQGSRKNDRWEALAQPRCRTTTTATSLARVATAPRASKLDQAGQIKVVQEFRREKEHSPHDLRWGTSCRARASGGRVAKPEFELPHRNALPAPGRTLPASHLPAEIRAMSSLPDTGGVGTDQRRPARQAADASKFAIGPPSPRLKGGQDARP